MKTCAQQLIGGLLVHWLGIQSMSFPSPGSQNTNDFLLSIEQVDFDV